VTFTGFIYYFYAKFGCAELRGLRACLGHTDTQTRLQLCKRYNSLGVHGKAYFTTEACGRVWSRDWPGWAANCRGASRMWAGGGCAAPSRSLLYMKYGRAPLCCNATPACNTHTHTHTHTQAITLYPQSAVQLPQHTRQLYQRMYINTAYYAPTHTNLKTTCMTTRTNTQRSDDAVYH